MGLRKRQPPPTRHPVADWAVQLLILLFCGTSIGWTAVVPSSSMETTLMVGDHLLVDYLAYAPPGKFTGKLLPYQEVERGDIIVFRYPLDIRQNYVKRVIGLPGDHVRLVNGQVIVNGQALDEPYKRHATGGAGPYMDNFPAFPGAGIEPRGIDMLRACVRDGELVVPEGHYFALGDNRDVSADSRIWGLVPRANIIGKPVLVFWSYEATTEQLQSRTHWFDAALHFFSKTRWDRTFRPVRPS
jgi:signal peptidase I